MDKKNAEKEEKKRLKMEKFLAKKAASVLTLTPKPKITYKKCGGYDPSQIESKWYKFWEENDLFKPVESPNKYVIPIPPPNVTGNLHIGHAMMISLQDTLCRYKRMCGFEVLYIPGTDHAGIATQSVVLKQLAKEEIKADRELFLEKAWEWKNKHGSRIYEQFKRMGTSVDFSRERFTLDPDMNLAVNEAFVRMYEKGMIYREPKIVNWCAKLATTVSDLEVNMEEILPNTIISVDNGKYEFGVMYHFNYPITDQPGFQGDLKTLKFIEIATTRPETILGDTAICVNPLDERFMQEGIDKLFPGTAAIRTDTSTGIFAINPLNGCTIPIILDTYADLNFGTGALKLTPAHDANDFELAKKHKLEVKVVMDLQNIIVEEGEFKGLRRFEARKAVVDKLRELGLFVCKKPYPQVLPRCSRSNDIIEPAMKSQWWLRCSDMAQRAVESVRSGRIEIIPNEAEKQWYRWLDNIRDWCLSRQLWWGHRIPAYIGPNEEWIVGRSKMEAFEKFQRCFPDIECTIDDLKQDEDVLDTWFSSGLWPFATLGWPNETADFNRYYPTSLLETGSDILFFWVARMVMLGLELTGTEPFSKILLHGIVRDAHGRKMSKSLGNVIDPIFVIDGTSLEELIQTMKSGNLDKAEMNTAEQGLKKDFPNGIPKCGADALRFALLSYTSGMKDINLDILRVEGYSRLCNKIWNASKFVKMMIDEFIETNTNYTYDSLYNNNEIEALSQIGSGPIKWISQKRNEAIKTIEQALDSFNFMLASQTIHQLFLYDFCDVYIEIVKSNKSINMITTLFKVFIDIIKIFHPFMPFITEEIFSNYFNFSISTAPFPKVDEFDHFNKMDALLRLIKQIRTSIESKHTESVVVEIEINDKINTEDVIYLRPLIKKVELVLPVEKITKEEVETYEDINFAVYQQNTN